MFSATRNRSCSTVEPARGRRSDRAQKEAPAVATLSLWGEAGAPPDYDPGAVTAPLELGQMAELEGPPGGGVQREAPATSDRLQEQLDLQVDVLARSGRRFARTGRRLARTGRRFARTAGASPELAGASPELAGA